MCVSGKEKLLDKNRQCITKSRSYVEKCHYEKLKKINGLNCFSNSKIIQPSLFFLYQSIWKPILCGHQTFVHCKCPPGTGDRVFSSIFVLPSAVNVYFQYA